MNILGIGGLPSTLAAGQDTHAYPGQQAANYPIGTISSTTNQSLTIKSQSKMQSFLTDNPISMPSFGKDDKREM